MSGDNKKTFQILVTVLEYGREEVYVMDYTAQATQIGDEIFSPEKRLYFFLNKVTSEGITLRVGNDIKAFPAHAIQKLEVKNSPRVPAYDAEPVSGVGPMKSL